MPLPDLHTVQIIAHLFLSFWSLFTIGRHICDAFSALQMKVCLTWSKSLQRGLVMQDLAFEPGVHSIKVQFPKWNEVVEEYYELNRNLSVHFIMFHFVFRRAHVFKCICTCKCACTCIYMYNWTHVHIHFTYKYMNRG